MKHYKKVQEVQVRALRIESTGILKTKAPKLSIPPPPPSIDQVSPHTYTATILITDLASICIVKECLAAECLVFKWSTRKSIVKIFTQINPHCKHDCLQCGTNFYFIISSGMKSKFSYFLYCYILSFLKAAQLTGHCLKQDQKYTDIP